MLKSLVGDVYLDVDEEGEGDHERKISTKEKINPKNCYVVKRYNFHGRDMKGLVDNSHLLTSE